jgi:signal peptidase I
MPDASVVLDRAARFNRTVFAVMAGVVVVSLLVLARGGADSGGGWYGLAGRRLFVVTSGSMSPTIRVGDAVVVKPISSKRTDSLDAGDVVTFRAANNPRFLITHRIVAVRSSAGGQRFYETKGDANVSADPSVLNPDRIVGVVTRVVPRLGSIIVALQERDILLMFLVGFLLLELAFIAFRKSFFDHPNASPTIDAS